jgi:arylsulfatase A-like enzyme
VLALLAACALQPACGDGGQSAAQPNVVVVVIDTLRADRLPFHGGPPETAPFLTELASMSLVFDSAWSTSSWTAPATASIFTGLLPNEHGVRQGMRAQQAQSEADEDLPLNRIPDELETLPTFFRSLGYRTFGAAANPNIGARIGFARGFDRFAPFRAETGKASGPLVEAVLTWKHELQSAQPFFLYLHLADPHGPYRRHARWLRDDSPPPRNRLDDLVAYDSEIRNADENLRRLFGELGLGPDTLIVFTADHGQEFLDHGKRGHGWQLYSELTRVPLFVHVPDRPDLVGRVAAHVSNADILATLEDLLVAESSPPRSLLAAARAGAAARTPRSMRTRHVGARTDHLFAIVSGRYKLILHEPEGRAELYDLVEDPAEKLDLAGQRPEVVAGLRASVRQQRDRARRSARHSAQPFEPSPELVEMLRELGYAEDGPNDGQP